MTRRHSSCQQCGISDVLWDCKAVRNLRLCILERPLVKSIGVFCSFILKAGSTQMTTSFFRLITIFHGICQCSGGVSLQSKLILQLTSRLVLYKPFPLTHQEEEKKRYLTILQSLGIREENRMCIYRHLNNKINTSRAINLYTRLLRMSISI